MNKILGKVVGNTTTTPVAISNAANALKGYASGCPLILTDVSPIQHDIIACEDIGGTDIVRSGKNLLDIYGRTMGSSLGAYANTTQRTFEYDKYYVGLSSANAYYNPNSYQYFTVELTDNVWSVTTTMGGFGIGFPMMVSPNYEYAISGNCIGGYISILFYDYEGTFISNQVNVKHFVPPEGCETAVICLIPSTKNATAQFSDIQVEFGTTITEYEPYVEPVAYYSSGGEVPIKIPSLYPTTVLYELYGGTVTAEYNRDINKVIVESEPEEPDEKHVQCITGEGAPTTTTEGEVGSLYMDTVNGDIYKCIAVNADGCVWVSGESANEETGELFEYEYSPNLLDLNSVQVGKVILKGGLYDSANYNTTDYISCKSGDTIRHQFDYQNKRYDNAESTATRMARIEAYDDTKKYIVDSMKTDAKVYVVPDGASFVRISYLTTQWGKTVTNNAVIICDRPTLYPYSEYGALIDTSLKTELRPKEIVKAFLPKEICVAVGRTIELYNNQVCLNAEKYHMQWNCTIGKALDRKFSVEGTTNLIGEYPLTLSVVDDNLDLVWVGSTKIKVVPASTESFSICCIGDSLTNNKAWLAELKALNSNINLVGTKGVADRKHEGRSGFSAESYLKGTNYTFENEGIHPFWDGERFNWNYYVTNSLGGVSPNAVQIFLGTNKIALDATENTANIKQIVDYIRQDDASVPIFVVNTLYRSNQNGIGGQTNTDGYNSSKGAFKYEEDIKVMNLMVGLNEALGNYANVYFVPVATCHDSANNYGKVEVAVNPRATDKEYVPVESVHPQEQGYLQMADIMFSSYSAHLGAAAASISEDELID